MPVHASRATSKETHTRVRPQYIFEYVSFQRVGIRGDRVNFALRSAGKKSNFPPLLFNSDSVYEPVYRCIFPRLREKRRNVLQRSFVTSLEKKFKSRNRERFFNLRSEFRSRLNFRISFFGVISIFLDEIERRERGRRRGKKREKREMVQFPRDTRSFVDRSILKRI